MEDKTITINQNFWLKVIIIGLICLCGYLWYGSYKDKQIYEHNISVSQDSIVYLKTKNDHLLATKLLYEGSLKDIKLLNDSLYKELKNLKATNDLISGLLIRSKIEFEKHDTIWEIKSDTIYPSLSKQFDFSNEYRILNGDLTLHDNILGMSIKKDMVLFDYTIGIDEYNTVYVTSNNPYVSYNAISGFVLPEKKRKRWGIGPFVGYGLGIPSFRNEFMIGIGMSYDIWQF